MYEVTSFDAIIAYSVRDDKELASGMRQLAGTKSELPEGSRHSARQLAEEGMTGAKNYSSSAMTHMAAFRPGMPLTAPPRRADEPAR